MKGSKTVAKNGEMDEKKIAKGILCNKPRSRTAVSCKYEELGGDAVHYQFIGGNRGLGGFRDEVLIIVKPGFECHG